jgi:hypothetical protein
MTTAPHPDPFEEFNRDLSTEAPVPGPITEEEIQRAAEWLASLPTAEVNN